MNALENPKPAESKAGSEPATTPNPQPLGNASGELIEVLADVEHERWSSWMRWLFQNGKWLKDGSFAITPSKANRWFTLTNVKYEDLDEATKEYDRIEVRKTLEAAERHYRTDGGSDE